jgi:hypothetical protein
MKGATFGPLVLLSIALLTFVATATTGIQYALGYTLGKLVVAVALALPIFLALRYSVPRWRRAARVELANVFLLATAAVFAVQVALVLVVPGLVDEVMAKIEHRKLPKCEEVAYVGMFDGKCRTD